MRLVNDPGKFEGELVVTVSLWEQTLDGNGDEILSGHYSGESATLLRAPLVVDDATPEESAWLATQAGVILCECSQGFVTASYYDDSRKLNRDWQRLSDTFAESDDPKTEDDDSL